MNPFENIHLTNMIKSDHIESNFQKSTINLPIESIQNQIDNDKNILPLEHKIEIWVENLGRKKNTYITGWNITDVNLKEHLKFIKKKIGCNGTIKKIIIESVEKNVILLQGNHTNYIYNYIISQGIDSNYIHIKG